MNSEMRFELPSTMQISAFSNLEGTVRAAGRIVLLNELPNRYRQPVLCFTHAEHPLLGKCSLFGRFLWQVANSGLRGGFGLVFEGS